MLAEHVEVVIGVDTHRETHTAAVVMAATGAAVDEATVCAAPKDYRELLALADQHSPCAWSHSGRCRNDAAFASLAGVAPLEASSGLTTRHRLSRRGDRQLNRALHVVAMSRLRYDPTTQAYAQRRRAKGKTSREIKRCIKRYVARQPFRQLENPHVTT
jgi:hypothetical protein